MGNSQRQNDWFEKVLLQIRRTENIYGRKALAFSKRTFNSIPSG